MSVNNINLQTNMPEKPNNPPVIPTKQPENLKPLEKDTYSPKIKTNPDVDNLLKPIAIGVHKINKITNKLDNSNIIQNLHQIDEKVYRGAAPGDEGIKLLHDKGIMTIIDFRRNNNNNPQLIKHEKEVATSLGMKYLNIPMDASIVPTSEQTKLFFDTIKNAQTPVFIHCKGGKDRTGIMSALYRVEVSKWSKPQAFEEMKKCGFTWDHQVRYSVQKTFLNDYKPSQKVETQA